MDTGLFTSFVPCGAVNKFLKFRPKKIEGHKTYLVNPALGHQFRRILVAKNRVKYFKYGELLPAFSNLTHLIGPTLITKSKHHLD